MTAIAQRVAAVRERVTAAARRVGRDPADVTLVAVTKTHPAETVATVLAAGICDVGENRVQEAEAKIAELAEHDALRWHLIGHLQRNKAKVAVQCFALVHSLDSVRLAKTLDRQVAERVGDDQRLAVLLQINVSGEQSKEGFYLPGGVENHEHLEAFYSEVAQILDLPHLHVQGLMTVAPFVDDPETVRPVFRSLRQLRDALATQFPQAAWDELSMGMTDDFELAIEEGATLVRVGRALFGERGERAG